MEGFSSSKVKSNLERLLRSLTPVVPSKEIPLGCISTLNQKLEPVGKQISEYFTLGDLWDWFEKLSACGAGTKVELKNGNDVVQYFVPYLSAIQIFTTKSTKTVRSVREDLLLDDQEFDSGFCSDESDGGKLLSRSESKNSYSSVGDTSTDSASESSSPTRNTRGNLYFMFHESCSPFWRTPLFDKITELAEEYPGLLTLKSTDLSPASWVAVSWYPIYHIPAKGPIEDLSAAFLTFHTLSSVFQDDEDSDASDHEEDENSDDESRQPRNPSSITLRPFGVASFKLTGNIWFQNELDSAKMLNLQHAAASWLKQLDFEHHDFKFFTTNVEHVYYY